MRKTTDIIAELRHVIEWSQPNIKYDDMVALVNELEASLTQDTAVKTTETKTTVNTVVEKETVVDTTESKDTTAKKSNGFQKKATV